jgi:hypothetical protein
MNEEKSEFANALYRLGKVAILRFAELLEKEGVNENTGKVIEEASVSIRNFEKAGFDCTEEKIALSKAQSIFNKSKNVMKELPIGTEIKLPFTTLKVEAIEKSRFIYCNYCFFAEVCEENGKFVYESFGTCDASEREDNTNVIFKEISHENME